MITKFNLFEDISDIYWPSYINILDSSSETILVEFEKIGSYYIGSQYYDEEYEYDYSDYENPETLYLAQNKNFVNEWTEKQMIEIISELQYVLGDDITIKNINISLEKNKKSFDDERDNYLELKKEFNKQQNKQIFNL